MLGLILVVVISVSRLFDDDKEDDEEEDDEDKGEVSGVFTFKLCSIKLGDDVFIILLTLFELASMFGSFLMLWWDSGEDLGDRLPT